MSHAPHVFTPAYYRRLYDLEESHGWIRGMRSLAGALLDEHFGTGGPWRVLDAGCGTGRTMDWLGSRYRCERVVGVDLSADALSFCRGRGHRALAQASVMELPFPDQSFDLVLSADVLQHLPDPTSSQVALREALRVLRPGGYLYVRTNTRCGLGNPEGTEAAGYRRFNVAELCGQLADSGFDVERASYVNVVQSLLASVRQRRVPWTEHGHVADRGLSFAPRPPALRWLDWLQTALLEMEARYLRTRRGNLPFGHTVLLLARKPVRIAPVTPDRDGDLARAAVE